MRELKNISEEVEGIFDDQKTMIPLTMEQQRWHNEATTCHICEDESRPFDQSKKSSCKVYDHCHLTGEPFMIVKYLYYKYLEKENRWTIQKV